MKTEELIKRREAILEEIVGYFSSDPAVQAIFVGGSLPAGSADAFSDVDLRVVVTPETHARFVENRLEMPKQWKGFLFNEWMPGAQHCVSHFRQFVKVDIFYYSQDKLQPSPWYSFPQTVLYDPKGIVSKLVESSPPFKFEFDERRVDWVMSKGLAAAHEVFRRCRRGELIFAQNLLEEFRLRVAEADDWIHQRVATNPAELKWERRLTPSLVQALRESYVPTDAAAIETAMLNLLTIFQEQVTALHKTYALSRSLANDLAAVDILLEA